MQSLCDRLDRVGRFPWAAAWLTVGTLGLGGLLGGGLGLIPFYATHPSHHWKVVYWVAFAFVAVVTVCSFAAAWSTHHERSESIADISADFKKYILSTFHVTGGIGQGGGSGAAEGAGEAGENS